MVKKTGKKKTKKKYEEEVIEETKKMVDEVQPLDDSMDDFIKKPEFNPFDAMFEEGPAPEPIIPTKGGVETSISKDLEGMLVFRNEKKKLTVYKCPETHKKVIVYDKAV